MDFSTYRVVRSQLNFSKPTRAWLVHILVDATLISMGGYLLFSSTSPQWGWPAYCLAQGLWAVIFFRNFGLMHEAVHHSLSDHPSVNDLLGVWAGLLCGLPYSAWKDLHLEHHQWAGNIDRDPSAKMRKDYNPGHRLRYRLLSLIWRSWVPLLGLMQQFVFWAYPIRQLKNPGYSSEQKVKAALSVLAPLAIYAGILWFWGPLQVLAQVGPAIIVYLALVEAINFPHHMDVHAFRGDGHLPVWEQYWVTRSSSYPRWFSRWFLLNFNLHTEHHLFPTLPWHQLDKVQPRIKAMLGEKYNESLSNAWILENRQRDLEVLLPVQANSPYPSEDRKAA